MSLYESLDSSGQYSISDLFRNIYPSGAVSNHTITNYAYLCCRGDWAAIEIKLYDDDAIHDAAKNSFVLKKKSILNK